MYAEHGIYDLPTVSHIRYTEFCGYVRLDIHFSRYCTLCTVYGYTITAMVEIQACPLCTAFGGYFSTWWAEYNKK
jgi:hypothetical protein